MWWPGISCEIKEYVGKCPEWTMNCPQHSEPLIPSPLPNYPREKVGTDLSVEWSHIPSCSELLSKFPEAVKLTSTSSKSIINALKSIFSRHGIPAVLISYNSPQFDSTTMKSHCCLLTLPGFHVVKIFLHSHHQQPPLPSK